MLNLSAEKVSGEYDTFALGVSPYGIFIGVGAGKLMRDVIHREDTPRHNTLTSRSKASGVHRDTQRSKALWMVASCWEAERGESRGWIQKQRLDQTDSN